MLSPRRAGVDRIQKPLNGGKEHRWETGLEEFGNSDSMTLVPGDDAKERHISSCHENSFPHKDEEISVGESQPAVFETFLPAPHSTTSILLLKTWKPTVSALPPLVCVWVSDPNVSLTCVHKKRVHLTGKRRVCAWIEVHFCCGTSAATPLLSGSHELAILHYYCCT